MSIATKQQLEQAFGALEASVTQLMHNVQTLTPTVDGYVTQKDAATYLKTAADTWGQMNVDVFESIRAELVEIMGQDEEAPADIVGKVNRMLEGINLMWSSIRKYMPDGIPSDEPLDGFASYIHT